jgi:hypothetical protein
MYSQWSSKQRIRLNFPFRRFNPISAFYPHFSVLSPFQRFIPISAFYPHFSVLSPFQRFIPISAFYLHFSVLSPFQFPLSVSVSVIRFQRFIPTPLKSQRYSKRKERLFETSNFKVVLSNHVQNHANTELANFQILIAY